MVSQVTLLPEKELGIVVLSNQQAFSALSAITHEVLEDALGLDDKDWVEELAIKHFEGKEKAYAQSQLAVVKDKQAALPNAIYANAYQDAWYGDINITDEKGNLRIDFTHTARLKGTLEHYNGNTFIARWDEKLLEADAFVEFQLNADNSVKSVTMRAVSPAITDFSFDFHNLHLKVKSK